VHSLVLTLGTPGLTTFIECVIFSEAAGGPCPYAWTAGYRSTADSPFEWRVTSSGNNSDVVSPMNYTNWHTGEPDWSGEACMFLDDGLSNVWSAYGCDDEYCSLCEL